METMEPSTRSPESRVSESRASDRTGDPQDRPPPWREITRRWHAVIPAVRRRWPELTYMETLRTSGDRNHLCRLISERYDVTLDEADDMVWRWHAAGPSRVHIDAADTR